MHKGKLGIFKALEEAGWMAELEARGIARGEARGEARGVAIGEARGEERKACDIARNLLNLGFPPETIVSATGLDLDKVQSLGL